MEDLNSTIREWIITLKIPLDPESITISWDMVTNWIQFSMGDNSSDIFHTTLTTVITLFSSFWNVILGFILAIYILASKESLTNLIKGFLYSTFSEKKAKSAIDIFHMGKKARNFY